MRERLIIGLLFATVMLVYGNALRDGFTMDDELYITSNPQVTSPSLRTAFAPNQVSNVFRPVTFATFAINWRWSGPQPFSYHLLNLLLHAAVTILFFFVLQAVFSPAPGATTIALVAAWLFAVHAIHVEAVTSIVGRSELLAAGFLLAAWLLHLRNRYVGALLCFALALLSKESAVVFLGLVLVGDYARGEWKARLRYAGIASMTLLYLGVLWRAQGGRFGQKEIAALDNPLAAIPAGWRILNALRVAWKYVGLQMYPAKLSCDYSFNQIPVYLDWRHTLPAAMAAAAAIGAWVWAVRKRRAGLVLAGGIYLAAFATTSNIFTPTGTILGERLAYLPSAGFCVLVAVGWSWLRERRRTIALGALAAVIAALAIRTIVRNFDWKDNPTLWATAVQAAPGSAKAHSNLSVAYINAGKFDLARKEAQEALRIKPDYPGAIESYGLLECWQRNYQEGGRMLEKALRMSTRSNPDYDYMAVNYAALLMQTGHTDGALELLNREIAESPSYARAWSNRAVIRYQRGDMAGARGDADVAVKLDPDSVQAKNLLQLLRAGTLPGALR
ncbi:MAG TPA: tetratricopeptide repeat protein [Candidatus Angelobacter sp.]|nr:tetratricopeptide repeat protein [Candidatus Angelobacter sp.]